MLGTTWRTTHLTILHIYNHQTSRFYDNHTILSAFGVVFSKQSFNNCSSTMDVGFVKILWDCLSGNSVFKMNIEFCCHLWCSSYLSLSCGFRQLFLLADDVIPWFVYDLIHTTNKVAILITHAPVKRVPTICPLWKSDTSLVYEMLQNTICKTTTLALHSISKQKNNESANNVHSAQPTQFYFYIV